MHAIIRKGNGEYYTLALFGYYSDKKSEYNYGAYYIALDEAKEHLIRFHYTEYNEVVDNSDIERLMNVSGWFHDAVIKRMEEREDRLRVLFDGVWGCKIEVFFE